MSPKEVFAAEEFDHGDLAAQGQIAGAQFVEPGGEGAVAHVEGNRGEGCRAPIAAGRPPALSRVLRLSWISMSSCRRTASKITGLSKTIPAWSAWWQDAFRPPRWQAHDGGRLPGDQRAHGLAGEAGSGHRRRLSISADGRRCHPRRCVARDREHQGVARPPVRWCGPKVADEADKRSARLPQAVAQQRKQAGENRVKVSLPAPCAPGASPAVRRRHRPGEQEALRPVATHPRSNSAPVRSYSPSA